MVKPVTPADRVERAGALRPLFRAARRGDALLVAIGAPIVVAVCWYLGTDVWHALVIGAGAAAVGVIWVAVPVRRDSSWPSDSSIMAVGGRRDVATISWALRSRYGRVDDSGMRHVREVARHRLALRQLDLRDPRDGPEITRLVGAAAYTTLRRDSPPYLRSVVSCLAALDRLVEPPAPTSPNPRPHSKEPA